LIFNLKNKMFMIKLSFKWTGLLAVLILLAGCHKDLDRFPPNDVTSAQLYKNEQGYRSVLAKVYGSMALTGNSGPAGAGDVAGIDEGTSDFTGKHRSLAPMKQ
jgi:starch-binding outer membrane protein, SusD/RagB family